MVHHPPPPRVQRTSTYHNNGRLLSDCVAPTSKQKFKEFTFSSPKLLWNVPSKRSRGREEGREGGREGGGGGWTDLKHVVDDVQLDHALSPHNVVDCRCVHVTHGNHRHPQDAGCTVHTEWSQMTF